MVTKNQIKLIKSLSQKKFRNKHELFVVEGLKSIQEFLESHFELFSLFTTEGYFKNIKNKEVILENDLKKISFLKTPQVALAIFKIPHLQEFSKLGLILALDGVRDPGNLGTIIRLCDWFGIKSLICSVDTVDCFNPKVIQASMGSLTRLQVEYRDLPDFLSKNNNLPIYGAMLQGANVYKSNLPKSAILVMGNESNGISDKVRNLITCPVTIPQFGENKYTESLNVATATSILLSEFRRDTSIEK